MGVSNIVFGLANAGVVLVVYGAVGLLVMLLDLFFAPINGIGRLIYPAFPVSILASMSAGVGEQINFSGLCSGCGRSC